MEKMQKRLDELELVQNNIKLMNELLSHYRPDSGDQERQLLQVSLCSPVLSAKLRKLPDFVVEMCGYCRNGC